MTMNYMLNDELYDELCTVKETLQECEVELHLYQEAHEARRLLRALIELSDDGEISNKDWVNYYEATKWAYEISEQIP